MKTKRNSFCLWGFILVACLFLPRLSGQDAEQAIKGMISDALGGSKDTIAINDSSQKVRLQLGGKRCVINGQGNVVRLDGDCAELIVNGTGNKIRVERVDAVRVLGANNIVNYTSGISSARPKEIRILGAGSSVSRSEK